MEHVDKTGVSAIIIQNAPYYAYIIQWGSLKTYLHDGNFRTRIRNFGNNLAYH
ncbi:hypothetical protein C0J52_12422 [Blattella germanica]|nr:hypothetical protein C0J52_12422 [Blattella germanica]